MNVSLFLIGLLKFESKYNAFIQEYKFESIVCKMVAIWTKPQNVSG